MRHILFLLFMAFTLHGIAQYPATGNKMRLGWQTTGDGLVYRGAIGDTATLDPSGLNNAWMLLDTANGNLYAYRAKAWRLVSGGGGGGLTMPFDSVTFNVNETDASQRELKYSEEKGYLQYGGLDSVQIPLLPGIWYIRNDTSVTIPKGTVVRATGTLGASGRIKVKHMIANGTIDAMYVLGIAMQDIAVGADGYVMTQGKIRQVNTQAYSEGAVLYADVDTLGGLTQTEPTGSNLKLPIAFVVHSASNGTLAVRVSPGTYLRDLHDVYITSPDSSASLYYNAAQGVWRDTTPAALKSDISGTTNRLAMFTGSNTVGNSVVDVTSDTVSIRDYSNSYTTWRFHSNINKRGFIGYPSGTRFYSLVNPSLYAGFMYGDRSAGAQDQQAFTQLTAWNGGGAAGGFFSAATTLNGADSTLYFNISGLSANANPTFPAAQMVIQKGGNVGINTTTPAHRLDVNGDVNTTGMYKKSGTDIISGTANYIPKFTGANTIGNSVLFDNGTNVGLANTSPISGNGGGLTIGSPSAGRGLHLYTSGSGLFMYPTGSSNPSLQMTSSDADSSILYYTYFNYSHKFFTTNVERFRISHTGNVGIATSSPSRPLHVAGTTAIRIPVGNFAQRGTSDNGDIRVRTDTASMEYYSGAWRTVAPMARVPQSGLANRFSKFDANGLLDTSAVLTQSNGRIGINATPTEQLQVGGTVRATRFTINTSSTYTTSLNNYTSNTTAGIVPNLWIGNGGASNTGSATTEQGTGNVGIGSNALRDNTTGAFNLAFGADALSKNTIGGGNIAIGRGAMANGTNESSSIGIGAYALQNNSTNTDAFNVAIGFAAMQSSTGALQNVGIGASSLSVTTGQENVAIGRSAMLRNTSGSTNTAVGHAVLSFNETGYDNVAIGWGAGGGAVAAPGVNKASNKSIYIGRETWASASGNTNEIVIGDQGRGNGSNTTTIGNSSTTHTVLQYGETLLGYAASGDVGDYRVQVNGNGYVSGEFRIGYTADQGAYPLQVNGQIFATNATIATSDARLKQDIEPLKSGLKEVLSLNPVTYTFKPDTVNNYPKGKQVGFLAQEIKATVQGDYAGSIVQEAGGYLGVADTKLIPLLVKAIQEQQAQIEALKKEIEALKNK